MYPKSHSSHHHHHCNHRPYMRSHGWHGPHMRAPHFFPFAPIAFVFFFFAIFAWGFPWSLLLLFLAFAMFRKGAWSRYMAHHGNNGEFEKRKNDDYSYDEYDDDFYNEKRKNDVNRRGERRYIQTEDGEWLEVV